MKKILFSSLILSLAFAVQAQITVSLTPSQDNTLYESLSGSLSNGAGVHLFAGNTNNGEIRRALIQFDLSSIPVNALVSSASISLTENKGNNGVQSISLHRALSSWGEGTSNAGPSGGGGASSTTGDATWIHSFFSTQSWTNAGGDFMAVASASTSTPSGIGGFTLTGTQLTSDVQNMIDGSSPNFGWLIKGNESASQTAKRFHAKEFGAATGQPTLTITYTVSTALNEEELANSISLYPIPAENFIQVKANLSSLRAEVSIFDISGKKIKQVPLQERLDLSGLSPGVYFLELQKQNGGQVLKKFILK